MLEIFLHILSISIPDGPGYFIAERNGLFLVALERLLLLQVPLKALELPNLGKALDAGNPKVYAPFLSQAHDFATCDIIYHLKAEELIIELDTIINFVADTTRWLRYSLFKRFLEPDCPYDPGHLTLAFDCW